MGYYNIDFKHKIRIYIKGIPFKLIRKKQQFEVWFAKN